MRAFIISSLVTFGLVFGGCASSDDADEKGSSKQAASLDEFCDVLCGVESECDANVDKDVCTSSCRRREGVTFENLRSDLIKGAQACIERRSCADIIGKDVRVDCLAEERAKLTTTAAVESFCEAARGQVRKCDGVDFDVAGCYGAVKAYNDGAITSARGCFDKSCDVYNDCLVAAIDVSIN